LEETGEPVDIWLLPPRVLDEQPLSLMMKNIRDPVAQPGSPGALSLGAPPVISPASTVSEQITFEPVILPEDTALLVEMDAKIP
jgi:hypothetical protein